MRRTTTLSREELNQVAQEVSSSASLIAEAGELHRGLTVAGSSESTVAEIVRAIRAEITEEVQVHERVSAILESEAEGKRRIDIETS